jgi:hypothetical protein
MTTAPIPFALLALLAAPDAHALVYTGNPVLEFRVDRPSDDYLTGSVTLDMVRVHHCGGGSTDYQVDKDIDPVEVNAVAIDAGDHCSITLYWDSTLDIDGDGSLGTFTVRYAESTTSMTLSTDIEPVALTPYSVVSGSMSGGSPWLLAKIE